MSPSYCVLSAACWLLCAGDVVNPQCESANVHHVFQCLIFKRVLKMILTLLVHVKGLSFCKNKSFSCGYAASCVHILHVIRRARVSRMPPHPHTLTLYNLTSLCSSEWNLKAPSPQLLGRIWRPSLDEVHPPQLDKELDGFPLIFHVYLKAN